MPELQLYGDIGEDYWDESSSITGKTVASWLARNAVGAPEITVSINTIGGDYAEGVAIHNLLAQHPAKIITRVVGFALSAGSVIAMAGDEIQMLPGTLMMVHEAAGCCCGTADDMEGVAKALRGMSDAAATLYADRTRLDKAKVMELMQAETWMTPADALALGFCTQVVSAAKQDQDAGAQATPPAAPPVTQRGQQFVNAYRKAPESVRAAMKLALATSREATPPTLGGAMPSTPSQSPAPEQRRTQVMVAAPTPFTDLARVKPTRFGD